MHYAPSPKISDCDSRSLDSLLSVVAASKDAVREILGIHSYLEVSPRNMNFFATPIDVDGDLFPDEADRLLRSLFSGTGLKLDFLAMQLRRNCFSLTNAPHTESEHGSRVQIANLMGQQSVFELEALYPDVSEVIIFEKLTYLAEHLVRYVATELTQRRKNELFALQVVPAHISKYQTQRFVTVSYEQAVSACLETTPGGSKTGSDLFRTFGNAPVFVTHAPRTGKQFIFKSDQGKSAHTFDLYLPGTGLAMSGGVLEDNSIRLFENFSAQVPGAELSEESQSMLHHYAKQVNASSPFKRGILRFNIEAILNTLLGDVCIERVRPEDVLTAPIVIDGDTFPLGKTPSGVLRY